MMMLKLGTSKICYLYLTDIIYIISTYFKSKIKSTSFSFSMQMAAFTVDFRKHSGTNTADDMAAQIITKLHTRLQATWILCLSTLPPDCGTLISN